MKSILWALALSSVSLAGFEGLYVGAGVGGHLAQATQAGSALGSVTNGTGQIVQSYPNDLQKDLFAHGVAGVLYAGYGVSWHAFYLAAEASLQFNSLSLHSLQTPDQLLGGGQSGLTSASNPKIHPLSGGFDLLPGWSPNLATLVYGRIGVSVSKTSLFTRDTDVFLHRSLALSKSRTHAALRFGGGLESRLTQNVSLRTDYIYTDYGSLSVTGLASLEQLVGVFINTSRQGSSHLYDHIAQIALSYHFCPSEPLCDLSLSTSDYCGFYFGVGCGGSSLENTLHGSALGADPGLISSAQVEVPSQLFNNQFQGTLYIGYAYPWEWLYLGAEAFITAATDPSMDFQQDSLIRAFGISL